MAEMPYCCAVSSFSSTSTLRKTTSGYVSANSANLGAILWHGPHHVAVKSINQLAAGLRDRLVHLGLGGELRHAAAEPQHQVQRRLLLDVVVRERAAVLELLAREDQPLLVGQNTLLVLNLRLHVL